MNRQRVNTAFELSRKYAVNQAMAFDPGLPFERCRHDIDTEMRFTARPVPGMARVLSGFINDIEALRHQSLG